jgi:hypothetical protein
MSFGFGQHVIKVSKGQTIQGVFMFETEDKSKEYFYFKEDGMVYIMDGTKKKPNKAIPFMLACAEDVACNEVLAVPYTFEKNLIEFSFTSANYLKVMEGQFQENGTKIAFKQSETNKILVVKEFERIE